MVGRMVQYAAELRRQFAHAVQIITRTRVLAGTTQHHNPNRRIARTLLQGSMEQFSDCDIVSSYRSLASRGSQLVD